MRNFIIFLFLFSCKSFISFNGEKYFKNDIQKKYFKNNVRIYKINKNNRKFYKSSNYNKNVEKIREKHYKNMFR